MRTFREAFYIAFSSTNIFRKTLNGECEGENVRPTMESFGAALNKLIFQYPAKKEEEIISDLFSAVISVFDTNRNEVKMWDDNEALRPHMDINYIYLCKREDADGNTEFFIPHVSHK